jgi:hypothetical protein
VDGGRSTRKRSIIQESDERSRSRTSGVCSVGNVRRREGWQILIRYRDRKGKCNRGSSTNRVKSGSRVNRRRREGESSMDKARVETRRRLILFGFAIAIIKPCRV